MAKVDFPPLLVPGIHKLTMPQLEELTVKPFPLDLRRVALFDSFTVWFESLKALGVSGKLWIDGSFLTDKLNPSDIDCVSFSFDLTRNITALEEQQLRKLVGHDEARTLYNLDFYMVPIQPTPEDTFNKEAYWKGVFGFQHDGVSAKGFVELTL